MKPFPEYEGELHLDGGFKRLRPTGLNSSCATITIEYMSVGCLNP